MELIKFYKGYKFTLKSTKELSRYDYGDATLTIENENTKKIYKIIHDFIYWIKIQKTQIKSQDILDFFENIGNYEKNTSNIFANKIINML